MPVDVDEREFRAGYRRLPGHQHRARLVLLERHRGRALLLVADDLGVGWRGKGDARRARDQRGSEMEAHG